jgi:hypothetical protein
LLHGVAEKTAFLHARRCSSTRIFEFSPGTSRFQKRRAEKVNFVCVLSVPKSLLFGACVAKKQSAAARVKLQMPSGFDRSFD